MYHHCTVVEITGVGSKINDTANRLPCPSPKGQTHFGAPHERNSSNPEKITPNSMSIVRTQLQKSGISEEITDTIMSSWREGTRNQYESVLKQWIIFCSERNESTVPKSARQLLEFLQKLFNKGLGYSSLNTARSAISSLAIVNDKDNNSTMGNNPLVRLFMRGVFIKRPQIPKTLTVWNPEKVLRLLKSWSPMKSISRKKLTFKTLMLMLLSTGHRGQTILSCNLTHVHVGHNKIVFLVDKLLKTSKPGCHISEVSLCSYSDTNLCPVVYLKEYIKRTRKIRQSAQLFVKLSKPHDKISRATLRRWTKTTLLWLVVIQINIKHILPVQWRLAKQLK